MGDFELSSHESFVDMSKLLGIKQCDAEQHCRK